MLGLHPFESMWHPRPAMSRRWSPPRRRVHDTLEPQVSTSRFLDAYTISVTLPELLEHDDEGASIVGAEASVVGRGEIEVRGGVRIEGQDCYTYAVRRSGVPVFSEPSTSAFLGHLRAGQRVKGGAPSSRGWIALDDDETWVLDDGYSLALIARPRPPVAFARRVGPLPDDALLERASVQEKPHGGIQITVPRRRTKPPKQQHPKVVPKLAPRTAVTQEALSRPRSAPTNTPAKAVTPPPQHTHAREKHQETARQGVGLEAMETALRDPKPPVGSFQPEEGASAMHSALHALSSEDPILVEVAASVHNVSRPSEAAPEENWVATDDGGFAPVICA
jgi:hypothetical protein